jgi:hypothetical protein
MFMTDSRTRGNRPELWNMLLSKLDDKLQLGLLDRLRRVSAYHFETEILFIDPSSPSDAEYLKKDSTIQQLQLFARDTANVEEVRICDDGKFPERGSNE